MINDDSLQEIIESWKSSVRTKLRHDQETMKEKIFHEFKKISKEDLLGQSIEEVFTVLLFDKKSDPLATILSVPAFESSLSEYLAEHLREFYDETPKVSEDGFNLMTYFEFLLNEEDDEYHHWCSYPQISYDIIEEADTYHFSVIRFRKTSYHQLLSFNNSIHPFIESLNLSWISQYKETSYDNTFRKAAASMNDLLGGVWDHINILSTLKYEGSHNNGSILFTNSHTPTLLLSLEEPVPLSEYRRIRKLLQMSRYEHYLLINANYMAIGFGYIQSDEPIYRIDFLDHLSWKLYYGFEEFLSCVNLLPMLPTIGNDKAKLRRKLSQTFSHLPYDESLILQTIEEAKFQRKGTMIVITEKAKEEAERLKTSSIKIDPIQINKKQLKLVTGIDGALIIDPRGYCHAVGTILDGSATDNGDSSRGARYNSALRYLSTQIQSNTPCLIAVISEDRYIDIISTH